LKLQTLLGEKRGHQKLARIEQVEGPTHQYSMTTVGFVDIEGEFVVIWPQIEGIYDLEVPKQNAKQRRSADDDA
jgi:hypothetical protein